MKIRHFIRNWKLEIGNLAVINTARAGIITDAPTIAEALLNALTFLLQVFGALAIIGIVLSGIMYLTAAGSEKQIQKAKKAFYYSVIGIVIAVGGWIIIKTISKMITG